MASVEGRSRPPTRELSPLETAARDGNAAEFLGLLGAADEAEDLSLALFLAAKAGALEIVEALLASGRRFGPGPSGRTALFVAITHGHLAVVEALAGADVGPITMAELQVCVTERQAPALAILLDHQDRFEPYLGHQWRLLPLVLRYDRKRLPEAPFTRMLLGFSLKWGRIVLAAAIEEGQRWAADLVLERYPGGEALPQFDSALGRLLDRSASFGWADIAVLAAEHAGENITLGVAALKQARDAATLRAMLQHPPLRRAALWGESSDSENKSLLETLCTRVARKRHQPLLECLVDELSPEELQTAFSNVWGGSQQYKIGHSAMPKPKAWIARVLAHAKLDGRMVQADALQVLLDHAATPADLADDPVGQLVRSLMWHTRYAYGAARNAVDQHQKATLETLLRHPAVPPLTSQHVLLSVQRAAQVPDSPKLWILQALLESQRVAPLSHSDRDALIAAVEEVAPFLLPLAIKWGGWSRRGPLVLLRSLVATERASALSVSEEADPFVRFLVCAAPRQVFRVATQFL